MEHWLLIFVIIINHVIFMCYAENADKKNIIDEIVQKVCSMAKGTLNFANDNEKARILRDLEEKLESTSYAGVPDRNLYVKMVMEGIKTMVLNNENNVCNRQISDIDILTILKEHNITEFRRQENSTSDLPKTIIEKLETMVNRAIKNKKTPKERIDAISRIKKKHIELFFNTYPNLPNKTLEIILECLNAIRARYLPKRRRSQFNYNVTDSAVLTTPHDLGLTLDSACDIVTTKTCTSLEKLDQFICTYDDTVISVQKICDGIVDCPDGSDEKECIKQAVKMVHAAGDVMSEIVMYRHCYKTLAENTILSHQGAMLSAVLQRQLEFVKKYSEDAVTESYLQQLKNPKTSSAFQENLSVLTSEVSLVMKTFVVAVHGALCMDLGKEADTATNISLIDELEDNLNQKQWSPKLCACLQKKCVNSTCSPACERFCYEKFILNRWKCQAASGEGSVSLNLLCDGKYDCLDESDELNCAIGSESSPEKFEAGKLFNDILIMLKTKLMSKEYESVSNHFKQLHDAIKTIHKATKRPDLNTTFFREYREKCFAIIASIYEDFLEDTGNIASDIAPPVQDTHEFLLLLGEKLMKAMKLTNIGNPKIIFLQGCDCRGNQCIVPACSKRCVRYCAVLPTLTEYACGSSPNNTRVSIHHICNGKPNCPNGEDEENCKFNGTQSIPLFPSLSKIRQLVCYCTLQGVRFPQTVVILRNKHNIWCAFFVEICRRHQLVVLRHNIKTVGQQYKGTTLGDVLDTWKARVISSIVVMEKVERKLTPHMFRETVSGFLHDLVNTFVSLQELRKLNSDHVLKKFEKLAQRLMESLKSCGK